MKVIKNYLWNILYQLFVIIVPLITIPYTSRVLGPAGVGINAYTNSVAQYFILFGGLGVGYYGNRQVAFVRDNVEKLTKTFYDIFLMKSIALSILIIIYIIFSVLYSKLSVYLLAQAILIFASLFDISWFFMGLEQFRITVMRNCLVKIISLIAIFSFVKDSGDTLVYILIISISTLLGNLTMFSYLGKFLKHHIK